MGKLGNFGECWKHQRIRVQFSVLQIENFVNSSRKIIKQSLLIFLVVIWTLELFIGSIFYMQFRNVGLYLFKFFKGCFPQILLDPFLNTLTHISKMIGLQRQILGKLSFGNSELFNPYFTPCFITLFSWKRKEISQLIYNKFSLIKL